MENSSLLSSRWYYPIEIEKGVFTKGTKHQNLALTRKLLRNIHVKNKACIDIGTQEAVIPILLKKAGANKVVGYDRYDLSQKIKMLSTIYQVDFEYIGGIQLQDLPKRLDQSVGGRFFDLVVFSGILYHMINPFGLMALVRGLCKVGGLFLIETMAIQSPKELLIFNAKGTYGPASNYFVPTTAWLDYTLRMLGLLPLEAIYLEGPKKEKKRLAILCRSHESPCPLDQNDNWMFESCHNYIFNAEAELDFKKLEHSQEELTYEPYDQDVLTLNNTSLFTGLARHPIYRPSINESILNLTSRM